MLIGAGCRGVVGNMLHSVVQAMAGAEHLKG